MARIILFGLAGAGKDTVAQMLLDKLSEDGLTVIAKFATELKRATSLIFGDNFDDRDKKETDVPVAFGTVINVCEATFVRLWKTEKQISEATLKALEVFSDLIQDDRVVMSPRKFQQLLGTEVVRSVDEQAWVNRTLYETSTPETTYIISDGRFENEALEDATLVYIFRPKSNQELKDLGQHSSEQLAVDLYNKAVIADTSILMNHLGRDFYILDNLGDLDELGMNVETFLEGL